MIGRLLVPLRIFLTYYVPEKGRTGKLDPVRSSTCIGLKQKGNNRAKNPGIFHLVYVRTAPRKNVPGIFFPRSLLLVLLTTFFLGSFGETPTRAYSTTYSCPLIGVVNVTSLPHAPPAGRLPSTCDSLRASDALPGGADILNETITDSLLQERYRKMLDVARDSKSKDGAHNPRS